MLKTILTGDVVVRDTGAKQESHDARTAALIEQAWADAQTQKPGMLFNGKVFSVTEIAGGELHGRFIEYKQRVAARRWPELQDKLRVRALAVSGLLKCADGYVFGRRGAVFEESGLWDFAPSGGLDPSVRNADGTLDFKAHALAELREEIGLSAEMVSNTKTVCVVEDTDLNLFDIIVGLFTAVSGAQVRAAFAALHNQEYDGIEIVDGPDLTAFAAAHEGCVTSLALYLVRALKLAG